MRDEALNAFWDGVVMLIALKLVIDEMVDRLYNTFRCRPGANWLGQGFVSPTSPHTGGMAAGCVVK